MPSSNVDLVRSIYADWERGDFRSVAWADPEIELVRPDSLEEDALTGLASTEKGWRDWLSAWDDYHAEADEYRVLDDERVLVLGRMSGRGRMSGAIGETETVNLFHIREGKVTRLVLYSSRDRAFGDLGLDTDAGAVGSPD
ncbi:MAG TPA: nuclear transport factor 2 family protein [Solirubrobacteraceae bacterium]|jgi:ketosteroid isomerase-like protein|nr:nuclear transport factor 2 family protein [Solirubrobacteraceae bacterium]